MRRADVVDADPVDLAYVRAYQWVEWLEPVQVRVVAAGEGRWACRLCVARYGLRAQDLDGLWRTAEEVRGHIAAFHHLNPYG